MYHVSLWKSSQLLGEEKAWEISGGAQCGYDT